MNYPRVDYEMTEEDLNNMYEACNPVPVMMIGGTTPSSPQENANDAWAALGDKMGFDSMTVQPNSRKGVRFFSAVPFENEEQRMERVNREAEEERRKEIEALESDISAKQERLAKLKG